MNRRDILSGLGGLLALGIVGPNLKAQAAPQAAGGWPIKPLPFDPKKLSPGYAFFAYPGKTFTGENRTPEVVRGLASLLRVHFRVLCIFILDSSALRERVEGRVLQCLYGRPV